MLNEEETDVLIMVYVEGKNFENRLSGTRIHTA